MASILLGTPSNQQTNNFGAQANPADQVNAVIQQILSSQNPTATFQQFVNSTPAAQNAINLANQYGNGAFNKDTFLRIAAAQGNQALANEIMQKLGLN